MSLSTLPSETLALILEFLADSDLATLLLAQRVSKHFQAVIQHILTHHSAQKQYPETPAPILEAMNPLLRHSFASIMDTAKLALSPGQHRLFTGPFYKMPWVRGEEGRERDEDGDGMGRFAKALPRCRYMWGSPHLRPEASWRGISVMWGMDPGIRRVEVVRLVTMYGGMGLGCEELEIPTGDGEGVLTMGLLYDTIMATDGPVNTLATRGWVLLPGRRLGSYDDWLKLRAQSRYPSNEDIMELFVQDEGSAVLFVKKFQDCMGDHMVRRRNVEDDENLLWEPEAIGGLPIVLRPWRGPVAGGKRCNNREKEVEDDDVGDGIKVAWEG
ncbi:uncharacterized protein GGS22DRAFT_149068 [Annulohypoxylon maeteangense]|uniref:uncharacterized protein n=1 Tax=Annulohypoxylon maeteangense TaxID=1927788 RepID=UPI00200892F8|nr:uncharacterized protein GGS22DRAFT_149068 [Annulohypoxylon maeteangense]KAI0889750.1 hypothetical protein GGS22DRAFT_149068 [Annulohypoxylon maeteangense]